MEKNRTHRPTESVCIQADKIYDSCRSKECISDLRVYFSEEGQALINTATDVRLKCAQTLCVDTDVEKAQFNNCCYNVSMTFYFKVIVEIPTTGGGSTCIEGLATYRKSAMLFGSEVSSYIFSSKDPSCSDGNNARNYAMPTAIVETLDPIALDASLSEPRRECQPIPGDSNTLPGCVCCCFPEGVVDGGDKRVYVTLGLFVMIRLQRSTQLLIPSYDFCIPTKECKGLSFEHDPCAFFNRLDFPVDAFYPADNCPNNQINSGCQSQNSGCQTTIPYIPDNN